ncbi:MAG: DNA repair exonuclease [Dehalococcoidia bacterium]|nr:DNA repair exonuclease [Dehalococcoidia bacterium]
MSARNGVNGRRHEVLVAHSSDLHLGFDVRPAGLETLERVLLTAARAEADLLLLAGDVFDHNRLPLELLDGAARLLGDAGLPVVILPGNHDCLAPNSVYRRGGLSEPPNVRVLGIHAESLEFAALDLQVFGRPHHDYDDMNPLADPPTRTARWQMAVAHGHWVTGPHDEHRSWRIYEDDLAECRADYLALGHWDRAVQVGAGPVPAYYSGSPSLAGTLNLVRLGDDGLAVRRVPIASLDADDVAEPPASGQAAG